MPDRRALGPSLVYCFDGSFAGLLCCIYHSYTDREQIIELMDERETRMSLYPTRQVATEEKHAQRVFASLQRNLGNEGMELLNHAFRCSDTDAAETCLRFIELGYEHGPSVCNMLANSVVIRIHKLYRTVWNESHHYFGFVRFAECAPTGSLAGLWDKNALAAIIEPRHDVLALIAGHFCDRYPEEHFIIYDRTRGQALVYRPYKAEIISLAGFELPDTADAGMYEQLWQGYYDAVCIDSRRNEKLRMQLMPKRFWPHLPELQPRQGSLPSP